MELQLRRWIRRGLISRDHDRPVISALAQRQTLVLREPLVRLLFYGTRTAVARQPKFALIVPATGEVLDSRIEEFKQRKMREWEARGVPKPMRTYAIELAERYVEGLARFLYPDDPEAQKKFMAEQFPRAVERISEPWIRGVLEALGT